VWYVAIIRLGNLAHLTYGFWFYLAIWETRCLKLCAYLWMVLWFFIIRSGLDMMTTLL
jgi:hypothetical protein